MLWSLTPFADELDVLEIRLAELDHLVGVHVIAEAPVTQTGRRKPLVFAQHKHRFDKWAHKIRHIVVDDMPDGPNSWNREAHQRNSLLRGCEGLADTDSVLISDLDEVPAAKALRDLGDVEAPVRLSMDMHPYKLNWRWPDRPVINGTRATLLPARMVRDEELSWFVSHDRPWTRTGTAGWHFSYHGGVSAVLAKVQAIADDWVKAEAITPQLAELSLETGRDLFGRPERQAEWVPDSELPACVQQNREQFAHMLVESPVMA